MKRLIVIGGPTASGKTGLAVFLAQKLHTEILSADSRQFYKEMSIGTAVPEPEELAAAPHHFIQHKSIFEDYNVGDFEKEFLTKSKALFQQYKTLILVGGSGLYLDAACKGLDKLPPKNETIRAELQKLLKEKGIAALQTILKKLDADYFARIDIHNPHRLIRAIEILQQSDGKKMKELQQQTLVRPFDIIYIGLNTERAKLYDRINKRVDIMMEKGLLNEARHLYPHKDLNALNTVGYKELFKYFEGEWDLDFAISEIKKNTRRFAKRQLTWFRKNQAIKWFDVNYQLDEIIKYIADIP